MKSKETNIKLGMAERGNLQHYLLMIDLGIVKCIKNIIEPFFE